MHKLLHYANPIVDKTTHEVNVMIEYPHLSEIPMGLGMALMQNKRAMDYYSALSEEAKRLIIEHTHSIRSKEEMQAYVDMLANNRLI